MKDFTGFRFGNVHTKDLHLVVVTSSDRYEKNLLPSPKDYTVEVPGGDGNYYFGQTFDSREFTCDVAFDSVDEQTWRQISQLFSTDKLQDLVFDELPYKTYRAKLKSKPEFKFICFTNRDTGDRVYKGEGTLNFVCYYPYAFGFNKYIVRAADYYLKTPPETIIKTHSRAEHEYAKNLIEPLDKHTKDFYNVVNNSNEPWKGGYPTFEQVQAGELYFNTPDGEKSIVDVRGYWENVPEWAPSSKLLTTPTLDYDQELIYLPQYCKTDYINMDTGLNITNAVIGSRLLVYNPGDLPIDFKAEFDANKRSFWTGRGNHFQVRRFNVQRLTIPQAVDWTGLTTQNPEDNSDYKYGNRYFKRKNINEKVVKETLTTESGEKIDIYEMNYATLGNQHPNHAYIVEPIPRELLGNFIRTFFMQSSQIGRKGKPALNFEDGLKLADRYEELYELCILDEERYELYWKTLKILLGYYRENEVFKNSKIIDYLKVKNPENDTEYLYIKNDHAYFNENAGAVLNGEILDEKLIFEDRKKLRKYYEILSDGSTKLNVDNIYFGETNNEGLEGENIYFRDQNNKDLLYRFYIEDGKLHFQKISRLLYMYGTEFDAFVHDFIHKPPEFIRKDDDTNYGEITFNLNHYPQWYTQDYLEILTEGMEDSQIRLDSEKRLLYSEYYEISDSVFTENGNYKPLKTIYNDNIVQGHWFQIPPGWSLIEVIPVCDERNWGGKTWNDARPFDWGYGGEKDGEKRNIQKVFDVVYEVAAKEYLSTLGFSDDEIEENFEVKGEYTDEITGEVLTDYDEGDLMNFRLYYMTEIEKFTQKGNTFAVEYFKNKEVQLEYGFLRLIQDFWSDLNYPNYGITGYIGEWWWYACNYTWSSFPPLYWGLADILTRAKIEYTPLFY